MSLELELQKYPKEIKLKDGSKCKLRPLRKDDEKNFHEFFLAVPEPERMFIKHRVTEPQVIRDWCQNIDLGRNLPLLALMDGKIVGDATLHQQLGGWKRHIGRVSVLVHPQYRGRGLARALVTEIVSHRPQPGPGEGGSGVHRRAGGRHQDVRPARLQQPACGWRIT